MFSDSERVKLVKTLSDLPFAQFEQIVFSLNVPRSVLPGTTAPQGERVVAFLRWSESSGLGLRAVEDILDELIGKEKFSQNDICPYKGLNFFNCNDEDYKFFFGREFLVKKLLNQVDKSNFLAIVGASGSGKSSLVRAGLLQILKSSEDNDIHIALPGEHPLDNLAAAFVDKNLSHIEQAQQHSVAKKFIKTSSDALKSLIETSKAKRVVLFVDQFEEVFSLCQDQVERQLFFSQLVDALTLRASKLCILVAMRSDFIGKFYEQSYEGFSEKIRSHSEPILPMTVEELDQVISRPAHQVRLALEPGLSQALLDDINRSPGKLALLQFALTELWKRKQNSTLSLSTYFEIGRVTGALQTQANKVYDSLSSDQQQIAKMIFLNLAFIGEDDTYMRNRIPQDKLKIKKYSKTQINEVIKRLSDEKLVVTSEIINPGNNRHIAIIDIAHEELIYSWPKFSKWLKEDTSFILWKQKTRENSQEWSKNHKDESFLLRGMTLREAEIWLAQREQDILPEHHEFIRLSLEVQKREEEKEQKIAEAKASIIYSIESDPILAGSKIISSGYISFHNDSDRLAIQNLNFQDDVMNFFLGGIQKLGNIKSRTSENDIMERKTSIASNLADRILGSPDIFREPYHKPNRSIHFVATSYGSTLNDLVSCELSYIQDIDDFNHKSIKANERLSCKEDTVLDQSKLELLRQQQIRNFLTILFIAQGTPMLLMGDEVRRTQVENTNICSQTSGVAWFNWDSVEKEQHLLKFTQSLIHFIQNLKIFSIDHLLRVTETWNPDPHIIWHGTRLGKPDWSENSHILAFTLLHPDAGEHLHVIFNASCEPMQFELPNANRGIRWHRIIDTALTPPSDFCYPDQAPAFDGQIYPVGAFSSVVLMAQKEL